MLDDVECLFDSAAKGLVVDKFSLKSVPNIWLLKYEINFLLLFNTQSLPIKKLACLSVRPIFLYLLNQPKLFFE